jgi:quinol monooxygenase YgiN
VALVMIAEIPELTREQYEYVVKKVNETGTPAGALFHAGGPIEGGYRTVEVWESRQAADAFYQSELLRTATAGLTTEPRITMTWQVYGVDAGDGWRATE